MKLEGDKLHDPCSHTTNCTPLPPPLSLLLLFSCLSHSLHFHLPFFPCAFLPLSPARDDHGFLSIPGGVLSHDSGVGGDILWRELRELIGLCMDPAKWLHVLRVGRQQEEEIKAGHGQVTHYSAQDAFWPILGPHQLHTYTNLEAQCLLLFSYLQVLM